MKKLLAMLLALTMLFVLVACDNGSKPPIGGAEDGTGTGTGTETAGGGEENDDPVDDKPKEYYPDPEAKYGGMVGVGTETGSAYFDDLKVVSRQADKFQLLNNDIEEAMPEFTYAVSVGGNWDKDTADYAQIVDPTVEYTEEDAEEDKNHVIAYTGDGTGAFAYTGDAVWNYYQYSLKVYPTDENTVVNIYFCIQDENNYFILSLGENGNTQTDCYQVINGEKASAAFKINYSLTLDAWNAIGITVERETIDVYLGGTLKMSIFNPEFINQYYAYEGEIIPSSITEALYGAPGEGLTYFQVAPENVIHDGKGTWGNNVANIATMAFDMLYSTFYDCDENVEYENTDAELVGIPGDGSHAAAYVGGYVPEGFKLTHIRYCPRSDQPARMVGGTFEISEDGTNWTTVYTVSESPAANDYVTFAAGDGETVYKYVRFVGADECFGNVAEIEIWGYPVN